MCTYPKIFPQLRKTKSKEICPTYLYWEWLKIWKCGTENKNKHWNETIDKFTEECCQYFQ